MVLVVVAVLVNGALVAGLALAFWNRRRAGPRQRIVEEMKRAAGGSRRSGVGNACRGARRAPLRKKGRFYEVVDAQ
jgi:hypothetical protein